MPYIKFDNIDDFNSWHINIMSDLGIPDGLGTVIYTSPIVHPTDDTVIANVDERVDLSDKTIVSKDEVFTLGYREYPKVVL